MYGHLHALFLHDMVSWELERDNSTRMSQVLFHDLVFVHIRPAEKTSDRCIEVEIEPSL